MIKKKIKKYILIAVITLIAIETVSVGVLGVLNRNKAQTIKEQEATIEEQNSQTFVSETISAETAINVLTEEINMIGELATLEYLYTDAAHFTDSKQINGLNIPLTKKSVLAKWNGTLKAGIDVELISVSTDEDAKKVIVEIPSARILGNEVDDDSFEILDESDGLFNKVTVDDTVDIIGDTKKDMEKRAIRAGILEKAEENAKVVITQILDANKTIKENYEIEFRVIEETETESVTETE